MVLQHGKGTIVSIVTRDGRISMEGPKDIKWTDVFKVKINYLNRKIHYSIHSTFENLCMDQKEDCMSFLLVS